MCLRLLPRHSRAHMFLYLLFGFPSQFFASITFPSLHFIFASRLLPLFTSSTPHPPPSSSPLRPLLIPFCVTWPSFFMMYGCASMMGLEVRVLEAGEAEAYAARLNASGEVDAVITPDGDSSFFSFVIFFACMSLCSA